MTDYTTFIDLFGVNFGNVSGDSFGMFFHVVTMGSRVFNFQYATYDDV